ncbi:MAG TPA: hypothetical protein VFV20_01530 [Candidatus Limnocylindria bacterium]|nr:hypothetical protein [Candidatus Limnocylindria bacterium]
MPLRRLKKTARTIDAALRDAHKARDAHSDPTFDRDLQGDRRATLRKFDTVEHALEDREKAERAKAGAKPGPGASKATKAKAKKK